MVPSIYGENMFDEFFDNNGFFGSHSPLFGKNSKNLMKTDIKEKEDGYELAVDLPGFKKEDIHVDVKDNTLSITAERHSEFEQKEKKNSYLRCERSFGGYTRSFDVTGVDTTKVHAAYNNGVLAITLPKYVKPQPTAQTISID